MSFSAVASSSSDCVRLLTRASSASGGMPHTTDTVLALTLPPMAAAHDVASTRAPEFWANEIPPISLDAARAKRQATRNDLMDPQAIKVRSLRFGGAVRTGGGAGCKSRPRHGSADRHASAASFNLGWLAVLSAGRRKQINRYRPNPGSQNDQSRADPTQDLAISPLAEETPKSLHDGPRTRALVVGRSTYLRLY